MEKQTFENKINEMDNEVGKLGKEIKKNGHGMKKQNGYCMYWSGVNHHQGGAERVGMMVKPGRRKNK